MKILSRIHNYYNAYKTTAANRRHSDTYVVEFPKSGITWLSTILANAALIESGRDEVANFVSTRLFVPDVHLSRHIGEPIYTTPPTRLIKSHSEYNPNYLFVIYLVRKPIPVLRSYFRFLSEKGKNPYSNFHDFCRSNRYGAPAWKRHVKSWLGVPNKGRVLHIVRYEDLLEDACKEVALISKNLGWGLGESSIRESVERSSISEMKASESLFSSRNPRYRGTFVKGADEIKVMDATISYIEELCAQEIELAGYFSD